MKTFASCISLILLPVALMAQTASDTSAAERNPSFLLANFGYTTNNTSNLPANAIRMPAIMATAAYYSPFGLYAQANYFKYLAATNNTYEFELGAGFEKSFLNHFDVDLSYDYRHFRGDSAYEGIAYRHEIGLTGEYRWKGLTVAAGNNLMVGSATNYFLDLSLSWDFKAEKFLFKSGFLLFSPTLSASMGTTYWISSIIDQTWGHQWGGGHHDNNPADRNFAYQNLSLILPLQYTLGSFTLSLAGFYAIPSGMLKQLGWTNQSGFLVSLSYSLIF